MKRVQAFAQEKSKTFEDDATWGSKFVDNRYSARSSLISIPYFGS